MKKLLLTAIILAMGSSLFAQKGITVLMENLPKKAEFFTLTGRYDQDFIYVHDAESPEHGMSHDAILCIDKRGNRVREISVDHPKMDVVGIFEGSRDLKVIYHKQVRRTDSIFISTFDKNQVNAIWNPELLSADKSKNVDQLLISVSPDRKKLLIGKLMEKKKSLTAQMMVFNENGNMDYEKTIISSYKEKHRDEIDLLVTNDGSAYFCYSTRKKGKVWVNGDYFVYLNYITKDDVLTFKIESICSNQGVVTNRGDYLRLDANSSFIHVVGFNKTSKKVIQQREPIPSDLIDNSWMISVCNHKHSPYVGNKNTYALGDMSAALLFEMKRYDSDEIEKLNTSTYKDKNGKTHTNTYKTTEVIRTVEFRGDLIEVVYNINEGRPQFNSLFKRQRWSGKSINVKEKYDCYSYRSVKQGDGVRVYFVDNGENYADDGTEESFSKHIFMQDYSCWATATIGKDGNFSPRERVVRNANSDFILKELLISYDNYWIIATDGDSRRKSNISTYRY